MAKAKNIVVNIKIDTAKATRTCHYSCVIEPGEKHLVVKHSLRDIDNFCKSCAGEIFDTAIQHLNAVRSELGI